MCFIKQLSWKTSQNLQENTCKGFFFSIKAVGPTLQLYFKKYPIVGALILGNFSEQVSNEKPLR